MLVKGPAFALHIVLHFQRLGFSRRLRRHPQKGTHPDTHVELSALSQTPQHFTKVLAL